MTRQYLGVALLAFVMVVLQSTLLPFINDLLYVDLLFVMVVTIGLFKDPLHGATMSCALGYVEDLLSSEVTGLYMSSRMAVFIIAQLLRGRLNPETPLFQFAIGFGLGILDHLNMILLHRYFTKPLFISGREYLFIMLGVLINAALVPIFFYIFRLIPGFIEVPRGPKIQR